ncbi:hypothetical protein GCM10009638_02800 [Luteococcus sanguinis]
MTLDFDAAGVELENEVVRIICYWARIGVDSFRVDVANLKPYSFWQRVLSRVRDRFPSVWFLAEAKVGPTRSHALLRVGFASAYSIGSFCETAVEVRDWLKIESVAGGSYLPWTAFWVSTHDGQPFWLRDSLPSAFYARLAIGALVWPSWGCMSGFEGLEAGMVRDPMSWEFQPADKFGPVQRNYRGGSLMGDMIALFNHLRRILGLEYWRAHTDAVIVDGLLVIGKLDLMLPLCLIADFRGHLKAYKARIPARFSEAMYQGRYRNLLTGERVRLDHGSVAMSAPDLRDGFVLALNEAVYTELDLVAGDLLSRMRSHSHG